MDSMWNTEERLRKIGIHVTRKDNHIVKVAVSDSGIGLSDEGCEKVFDAFYTTKENGMGMGLAISRTIIENHGGHLLAAPNTDGGTIFYFTLPK